MEKSPNMQNRSAASCQDLSTNSWKQRVRHCHYSRDWRPRAQRGQMMGVRGDWGQRLEAQSSKGRTRRGVGVEEVPSALK